MYYNFFKAIDEVTYSPFLGKPYLLQLSLFSKCSSIHVYDEIMYNILQKSSKANSGHYNNRQHTHPTHNFAV